MARFRDRADAARQLAARLDDYRGRRPLILAIPRGGVPLGRVVADALDGDLDVALVHKIGAPQQPELAVGAVDEHGRVVLDDLAHRLAVPRAAIDAVAGREVAALRARRAALGTRTPLDAAGRVVIVVDDGIATGSTARAAVRLARAAHAASVIVATPVAPPETAERLAAEADAVICVLTPPDFAAVGQYYDDFSPVEDDAVRAALEPTRR